LRTDFDPFLYASIGEDCNGTRMSVLTGLARSDLDPWQEAARLATLSVHAATERLIALIRSLPGRSWTDMELAVTATRLVALLPHGVSAADGRAPPQRRGHAVKTPQPWLIFVVLLGLAVGAQLMLSGRQHPASESPPDRPAVSQSGGVSPPQPPLER
jgi:hypothetical protein